MSQFEWNTVNINGYLAYLGGLFDQPGPYQKEIVCAICHRRQIGSYAAMVRHIVREHSEAPLPTTTAAVDSSDDEETSDSESTDSKSPTPQPIPCEMILRYGGRGEPTWVCGYIGWKGDSIEDHRKDHHDPNPLHAPRGMPIFWRDDSMPHRRLYFNEDTKMWTCPDGVQRRIVLRECSSAESTPAPVTPTSPSIPLGASHSAGYYDKPSSTPWHERDSDSLFIRQLFGGENKLLTEQSLFKSRERLPRPVMNTRYAPYYVRGLDSPRF